MSKGPSPLHVTLDASMDSSSSALSPSQPVEVDKVDPLNSTDTFNNSLALGQLQFTFDNHRRLLNQGDELFPDNQGWQEGHNLSGSWSEGIYLDTGATVQQTFDVKIEPHSSTNESYPTPIIIPIQPNALDAEQRRRADFERALTESLTERIGEGNFTTSYDMAQQQALDALESGDFPDFFDNAVLRRLILELPEAIRTTETKGFDHYLQIFAVLWPDPLTRQQVVTLNSNQQVQFLRNWFITAVNGMFEVTSYNPGQRLAGLRKGPEADWIPAGEGAGHHKDHHIEYMMSPKLTDVATGSLIYPAKLFTCE